MSVQKSWAELQKMHRACGIVVDTLDALKEAAVPGVATKELDRIARERIEKAGARPAFLGYRGYPATLCISINEEVVHGIPGQRKLREGDIVGLDLGCVVDGFFGDAARTVAVGKISDEARRLMKATEEALHAGITVCRQGMRVGDIGHAVQQHAEAQGYSVVREFVGHGIGTSLHEEPQVPNYGPPGRRERLVPGMCLAIEPMVNAGGPEVRVLKDGWTAVTADQSLSAHFELSIAITRHGPWILSEPYPYASEETEARHA
ncbi:MAG TPA: type I methionyl aminopeptidase [Vicinamibacteria bacterium]|jgi:methionyl aminopeptidase|nr:type I methionyl aminopeptidase [Vicinamibacteria bacterium]